MRPAFHLKTGIFQENGEATRTNEMDWQQKEWFWSHSGNLCCGWSNIEQGIQNRKRNRPEEGRKPIDQSLKELLELIERKCDSGIGE